MKIQKLLHRKPIDQRGFSHVEIFIALVIIAIVAVVGVRVLNGSHAATICAPDAKLVNPCRSWQGAASAMYPNVGTNFKSRMTDFETRTGAQLDFVHDYSRAPSVLTADQIYYINRPNTYLLLNYKPAADWASAGGSNATVNANIDAMATSIKSVAPKKIMLNVWHEMENDVTGGASGCPANYVYKGSAGTVAQYKSMWQNVRNRFDAKGVTNVVWAVNYMSDPNKNCMQKELYPGNNLVDWVLWDKYFYNGEDFNTGISKFYTWLTNNSDASHDFLSKPWGIGEWGTWDTNQDNVKKVYSDGGKALIANSYPKIKLWTVWDSVGTHDNRVQYTLNGILDQSEQDSFNINWARNAAFKDPVEPPATDTIAPTVSISSPLANAAVSGTTVVSVTATDNKAVTRVVTKWDGNIIRDATSQNTYGWGSRWDTTSAPNGNHTITATAYDAAGNTKTSSVTVKVGNGDITPPVVNITSPTSGTTVKGTYVINVTASDNVAITRVAIAWDGSNPIRDNTVQGDYGWGSRWNTTQAPNGTHTVTATAYDANGNTSVSIVKVTVNN